ncbi:MAG TPA: hypothetical protein VGC24_04950 [Burkholderiaceae bacterium]
MSAPKPFPYEQIERRRLLEAVATCILTPVAGLLGACGGSDESPLAAPETVPPPASDDGTSAPTRPDASNASPNRSITINLANRLPDLALAFSQPVSHKGSLPQTLTNTLPSAGQAAVIATNNNGDCTGSFRLANGEAWFDASYTHPYGPGDTTVSMKAAPGYLTGANATTFPGHHSMAHINLYQGVRNAGDAWVVPLGLLDSAPWNNSQDFVNSLFAPNVRNTAPIHAAYGNTDAATGLAPLADFTGGQLSGFTARWQAHWLEAVSDYALPLADAKLLDLLKSYVDSAASSGPLTMWVPQLRYLPDTTPAAYELQGYRRFPFRSDTNAWATESVGAFLTLLAAGAHFVAICANHDMPDDTTTVQAFDHFLSNSGLSTKYDIGNSHYTLVLNTTGHYYLGIDGNFAPENCGLLLALLNGRTVNNTLLNQGDYNSFIQLEGWQAGSSRHNADYVIHEQTLWNISTFGASVYSEKRATSVFLAPAGWVPQIYQTTRMMPYLGAYAVSTSEPQSWLRHDLVSIPADAPPLPARYVLN